MQQPQISFTPTTMFKSLFSLLILSLLYTNSISTNLNSSATICPWFSCGGDNVTIRYPFWENSPATAKQYCGYPQFGLTCSPEGETILKLPGDGGTYYNYSVKDIDYKDHTLTLVDAAVVVDKDNCPRVRQNISLESVPLNYSPSNLYLSFYFNCTVPPSASATLHHIDCLRIGSDGKQSYVFVVGEESDDYDRVGNCEEKVVTAVMRDEINVDDLIDDFGGTMKEGFVLNWRTEVECGTCEKNGGRCGYNNTPSCFLCFCKNGTVISDHCKGKGHNGSILSRLLIGAILLKIVPSY